jgi:diguanylate cyclase (GGDEF)-like protein/PAS domain S-box-containing protein
LSEKPDNQYQPEITTGAQSARAPLPENTARPAFIRHNQVLMRHALEGIHIMDDRGNLLEANDAFCRHLGYTHAEALRLSVFDWEAKMTAEELRAAIRDALDHHARFETVHRRKDGTLIDVEVSVGGIELEGSKYLYAASHDIAERKQTKEALDANARFFSTLAQVSPVGIFRTDAQGSCVYANERWCKITGMKQSEALGTGWMQAVHPDDRGKVAQAWYTSAQAHHDFIMEYRIQRPTGATRWILGEAAAERDAAGKVIGYVGTIADITQSKQAEEEFQRFFNLTPDLACIASTDGRFLKINPMWQETLGYTEREILAKPFLDLIHPDDRDATMKEVERQLSGEQTLQFTNRYRCKGGGYKWLEWKATPVVDGKLLFASARDITERKKLEEARQEAQDRFQKITQLAPGIVYQFRLRPDGSACIPYASEAAREIYRLDPEEVRDDASKIFTLVHPDDLENFKASIQASARDMTPWQHEYRLRFDDGAVRWLFGNSIPQHETDGSTLWHGFITDITERKAAEKMLHFHSEILLNLSEGVFLIRASDGVIVFTNPQFERIFGYGPGELLGKHVSIVNAPGERSPEVVAAEIMGELARAGKWRGEVRNVKKDGTVFWCHASVLTIDHPQFGLVWISVHEDITERKKNEERLRQSEERLRAYLDNISDTIWLIDANLNMAYVSPSVTHLLGVLPEELIGRPSALVIHPDDMGIIDNAMRYVMEHPGEPHTIRYRVSHKDGRWVDVESTGVNMLCNQVINGVLVTMRDITERKQAEQALTESESRFREIFNTVSDAIFIHDAETGRIIDVNRRMLEMYGLTHEQALASDVNDLSAGTPPYSTAEAVEKIRLAYTDGPQTFDWLARARDGHLFWVEVSLKFALIGSQQRILAVVRDISERKRADEELRIAATAFESQDGMVITDADSVILRVNHAFTEITGYTAQEAIGQTPRLLSSGRHDAVFYAAMWKCIRYSGVWQGEIWNRRKSGEVYPERLTITAVKGDAGEVTHYVATMHDITERKAAEEEINSLAFYDTLTQLPNRRMLDDRLGQAMAASKRSGHYGALMFLDLDNFKPLNDTHGHGVGDLLLREVAHRLTGCVREVDTVARFGGDEFVVMLSELGEGKTESTAQAGIVAEKIRAALAEPYLLTFKPENETEMTVEHRCAASIGVVAFNSEASAEKIIKWADIAMYQAKEGGRNLVHFFEPESGSS